MAVHPVARFKDLCVDVVDVPAATAFWSAALGRRAAPAGPGEPVRLEAGGDPRRTVWLNPVPEPVTVKQRVHLDVHCADHRALVEAGASVVDADSFRWQVLRDPDGGELCAFEREQVPDERLYEVVVDCTDPRAQARWWAEVLGGRVGVDEEHGWAWLEQVPGMPYECLVMVPVAEAKVVKNRVHWDVDVAGRDGVDALVARGASVVREAGQGTAWWVLADPEGNEFCVFTGV